MRISDWSSDVCSSDLRPPPMAMPLISAINGFGKVLIRWLTRYSVPKKARPNAIRSAGSGRMPIERTSPPAQKARSLALRISRSEEHTSELQSLMRISYAVFCLKKKNKKEQKETTHSRNNIYTKKHNIEEQT